jgi:hypothetical protein
MNARWDIIERPLLGPGVLFFYIAGLLTSEIVLNPLVFESQWVTPIDNG